MAFTIPNLSVAAFPAMSRLFSVDFDILAAALAQTGVKSGCAVTAQGSPNMTVAVASGSVYVAAVEAAVSSGNVTITTANGTNPRIDLVVANSSGTKSVTAGTAAVAPEPPAIPASSVVLAYVYVPAADTAINTNQITDKRAFVVVPAPPAAFDQIVRKTTDEPGPNNTTLQNDDQLVLASLAAGTYIIEGFLAYIRVSGISALLRVGWSSTDGSATFEWTSGLGGGGNAAQTAIGGTMDFQTSAGASSGGALWGRLILTVTANLQLRWCDSTGADPITMRKGSMLRATKVV